MAQKPDQKQLAKTDAARKHSLKDIRKWVDENMELILAYHGYARSLKRNRETATVESAVRGIGQDMERLLAALDKISSSGKKETKATAFPSPRG